MEYIKPIDVLMLADDDNLDVNAIKILGELSIMNIKGIQGEKRIILQKAIHDYLKRKKEIIMATGRHDIHPFGPLMTVGNIKLCFGDISKLPGNTFRKPIEKIVDHGKGQMVKY
jgi:hypothetical protein